MRAERVKVDCHQCGGSGGSPCKTCRGQGTTWRALVVLKPGVMVRGDGDGFEEDRQACPCYEGICVNEDVAQCRHRDNSSLERTCALEYCPIAQRCVAMENAA